VHLEQQLVTFAVTSKLRPTPCEGCPAKATLPHSTSLCLRFHLIFASALAALSALGETSARGGDIDEGIAFKSVGVAGNPLAMLIGRYSADLEYLPLAHHALHLTPFGYYALPGVSDQLTGLGGEIGYRWYSGTHGPDGFFAGASFVAGDLEYRHIATVAGPLDASDDTHFVELGGALDAGYQILLLGNLAVGVGAGAQYVVETTRPHFEFENHPWHDVLYGAGLRPRALLSVGAAF
jgi:hypothetical protein